MKVINENVMSTLKSDVKKLFDTLDELKLDMSDKQRSELISGLVENAVQRNIPNAVAPKIDSEPDLYIDGKAVEIKTTAGESWRGGAFSKRPGYYIFVSWKLDDNNDSEFFMGGTHMKESDWKASGSANYYATTYGKRELANNSDTVIYSGNLEKYSRGKTECVRVLYS
tara:strand:- start:300 stop:806 length:507 start_codon:yes stop_codon:yes gene_type:complete